jgi:hypothetical protein
MSVDVATKHPSLLSHTLVAFFASLPYPLTHLPRGDYQTPPKSIEDRAIPVISRPRSTLAETAFVIRPPRKQGSDPLLRKARRFSL